MENKRLGDKEKKVGGTSYEAVSSPIAAMARVIKVDQLTFSFMTGALTVRNDLNVKIK